MKKLIEIAQVLRSKNAGPLFLTFDLIFRDKKTYQAVLDTNIITPKLISDLYDAHLNEVSIFEYDIVNSIKVTIPRKCVSGSIYDMDIYGCGQHMALANVLIPWED